MNKKLSILLALLLASVFSFAGCKKDAKKDDTTAKKEVAKTATKETKGTTKKDANTKKEVATKGTASKLDLSYFPENAVIVGSFNIKEFYAIKELKPIFAEAFAEAKKEGIDLEKLTFLSYYMNLDSLKKADDVAVLVNNFTITEELLTKMKLKVKKEKYNGFELLLEPNAEGGFVTLGKDLLAGSTKSIKKMLDVKSGKAKSLASSEAGKEFKLALSKSGNAAFKIVFVPNKLATEQMANLSKGQGAMAAEFLNNIKSASFSISISKDAFTFGFLFHSSKAGVDQVVAIAKPQLAMLTQPNSPMLGMVQPILGKEGTEILTKVIKTLKVNNDGEYLAISFSTKFEYWQKAPKIFGDAMKKMGK